MDRYLGDLGKSLLAFVYEELGPVDQVSIYLQSTIEKQEVNPWKLYLFQCSLIVSVQFDSLPHACRLVSSLYGLHIQIDHTLVFPDGGIATVGQGTCLPRTQTSHIVLIPTECVLSCPVT